LEVINTPPGACPEIRSDVLNSECPEEPRFAGDEPLYQTIFFHSYRMPGGNLHVGAVGIFTPKTVDNFLTPCNKYMGGGKNNASRYMKLLYFTEKVV
jgi:hypothetical protein